MAKKKSKKMKYRFIQKFTYNDIIFLPGSSADKLPEDIIEAAIKDGYAVELNKEAKDV